MTPYRLLLNLSGLSIGEAAAFHGVRPDTAKSWAAGRNRVPDGAIAELRGLIARQERAAAAALAKYRELLAEHGPPETVRLSIPPGDWPCRSAGLMALARVAAGVGAAVDIADP